MNIYIEIQITESEAKEAYQEYVEECAFCGEEPSDYEEFKETVLAGYVRSSLDEGSESVVDYLEGDWLKIEGE